MSRGLPHCDGPVDAVHWARGQSEAGNYPPLREQETADVVIIGGGYTGLSAALTLAEAGRSVILLEAVEPGAGASGRNAGHVVPFWNRRTPNDARKYFGDEQGAALARFVAGSAARVFELVKTYGMDCDARPGGHLSLVGTNKALARGHEFTSGWRQVGAKVRDLNLDEAAQYINTPTVAGGWMFEEGGYINPMDYARGLASALTTAGGKIYAGSPVHKIGNKGGKWVANTPGGNVRSDHLIIAVNAYAGGVWPRLGRAGYALTCGMLASDPVAANEVFKWRGPWAWADDLTITSGAFDSDGALLMSVLPGATGTSKAALAREADRKLARYFPTIPAPRWRGAWTGRFMATTDGFPRLVRLADRAYTAFGYNGNGIAPATAFGQELAKAVEGRDDLALPVTTLKSAPMARLVPWLVRNVMTPLARAF